MSVAGLGIDFGEGFLEGVDIPTPDEIAQQQEDARNALIETYGDREFPYVYTARNDDLNTGQGRGHPILGLSVEMVNAGDLYDRYMGDQYARQTFGTFDNYIGYLGDLLDLAKENPEIAWWNDYGFRNLTGNTQDVANFYGLNEEDARMGSGERIDAEQVNLSEATDAFDAMVANPAFQQLVADRGIETQFNLSGDDVYVFNGLGASEIYEGNDTFGSYFSQAMEVANNVALGMMGGQVLGPLGAAAEGAAQSSGLLYGAGNPLAQALQMAGGGAELAAGIGSVAGGISSGLEAIDRIDDRQDREEEEAIVNIGVIDPLLTGDPGDLFEPDTPLEEAPYEPVEIDAPFIDYDPVFPVELPEAEGGGATAAPEVTEDITEETPTTVEAGAGDIEPEAGYVYEGGGIFRDQKTGRVVEQEIQGDDPYVIGEVYSTGPTPIQEDVTADDTTRPGVGIVFAPVTTPSTGTDTTGTTGEGTTAGDGTGDDAGDDAGTGERRGMFQDKFTPFTTSIGYTPVQLQQLITPPKKDYMRELDGLFGRLLG